MPLSSKWEISQFEGKLCEKDLEKAMKTIATIALLVVSLNSYARPTIEECNEKAAFEDETLNTVMSTTRIHQYLTTIDRSKWEHALKVYELYNTVSVAKINGKFQTTTLRFHLSTMLESDSIECYRKALNLTFMDQL